MTARAADAAGRPHPRPDNQEDTVQPYTDDDAESAAGTLHIQMEVRAGWAEVARVVRSWIVDRCAGCGKRFRWKDARRSYLGTDKVWHDVCMTLRHRRLRAGRD